MVDSDEINNVGFEIQRSIDEVKSNDTAKNDGYIKVNSTKGSGNTCIVSLPMAS